MIELRGVSKRFGEVAALRPTTLCVDAGKTTVLIGPSGCGKSTILRIIIGLITPDTGDVRIEGETLTPANVVGLRRRMGYVIQEGGLFPHLTARRNVTLMARHLGRPASENADRVAELAELTHFPPGGLDRFPGELSGGQRQRVSLMRALMLDPEVLLLDEPLGALDPMIRSSLQVDLAEIFKTLRKTVVMVTHDLAEAALFADNVVLLAHGRVVQQGTLKELLRNPANEFVSEFVRAQRSVHGALEPAP